MQMQHPDSEHNIPPPRTFWNKLRDVFWNEGERRPRALWRIALFCLLFLVVATVFMIILLVLMLLTSFGSDATWLLTGGMFISLVATVISVMIAARFLDRRPFVSYGFQWDRNWWIDLGFGLWLGAFLMGAIFLIQWGSGWVTITGVLQSASNGPVALSLLDPLFMFICVGIYEELLFRGYLLRNMAEGTFWFFRGGRAPLNTHLSLGIAWIASSALFGIAHLFNANSTIISTVNISFAGIFLGIGYILTRQLAIPIGLHISWNLFQGTVFGFPVSGNDFPMAKVIVVSQGGPDIWTGGKFGPEAGLLGIIAMVVGILLTILWIRVRYGRVGVSAAWGGSGGVGDSC